MSTLTIETALSQQKDAILGAGTSPAATRQAESIFADADPAAAELTEQQVDEAIKAGSTREKATRAHQLRTKPPSGWLQRIFVRTKGIERELENARADEESAILTFQEHEALVTAVECAGRDLARVRELLAGLSAPTDDAEAERRVGLQLRDDPHGVSNCERMYSWLASLEPKRRDLEQAVPIFEKRVSEAKNALAAFEKQHRIG